MGLAEEETAQSPTSTSKGKNLLLKKCVIDTLCVCTLLLRPAYLLVHFEVMGLMGARYSLHIMYMHVLSICGGSGFYYVCVCGPVR